MKFVFTSVLTLLLLGCSTYKIQLKKHLETDLIEIRLDSNEEMNFELKKEWMTIYEDDFMVPSFINSVWISSKPINTLIKDKSMTKNRILHKLNDWNKNLSQDEEYRKFRLPYDDEAKLYFKNKEILTITKFNELKINDEVDCDIYVFRLPKYLENFSYKNEFY